MHRHRRSSDTVCGGDGLSLWRYTVQLQVLWRGLVVKGHETIVGFVYETVETDVEGEDGDDDEPAGDEVYEKADSVRCEPAP